MVNKTASSAERFAQASKSKDREHLQQIFNEFDADGDGTLSCIEMRKILMQVGLKDVQVKQLFKAVDADNNGEISYLEFTNWLFAEGAEAEETRKHVYRTESVKEGLSEFMEAVQDLMSLGTESATLNDIFQTLDCSGNKVINMTEFVSGARAIGLRMDEAMLQKIFNEIDTERKKIKKKKAPKLAEGWDADFQAAGVDARKHLGDAHGNVDQFALAGVPNMEANDTRYCGNIEKKKGALIHSRYNEYEEVKLYTDPRTGKVKEIRRKVNEGGNPDKLISFKEFEAAFNKCSGL